MVFALYATIWVALALFVAGEAGRVLRPLPRWPWWSSFAGAIICGVHIVIAMGYHHHWSHASAIEETARQTASVYGLAWGGGVYVNYVFVAAWLMYLWRWRTRPEFFGQNPGAAWGLRAFFFVIIFNATVVFAASPMRLAGVVLSVMLGAIWLFQSAITQQSQESRRTAAGSMREAR